MTPFIKGILASGISGRLSAGPVGSYDALATITVPSGGVSSITFSGIPAGYRHLEIRATGLTAGSSQAYFLQFNGDTAANYSSHWLFGDGASAGSGANTGWAGIDAAFTSPTSPGTYPTSFVASILDYEDENKFKTVRCLHGVDANGSGYIGFNSGAWRSTNPINSITIRELVGGGNINQNSQFALYGVK